MAFLRRKSGVYHEDIYHGDPEPQPQRRRLSKPPTNNSSSTNLPSAQSQQVTGKRSFHNSAQDTPITLNANDSREAIRSHLFSSTSELDLTMSKPRAAFSAYMATTRNDKSAQASTSQLSLVSPTLPTNPISTMLSAKRASDSHKPSISSLGSKDRYATDHDLGTVSSESSTEHIAPDPAPPARRTASFTPGMATRVPSAPQEAIQEESESAVVSTESVATTKPSGKVLPKIELERDWSPPPPNERPVTPTDLDVSHIGRLGLGSLHVVNGRASPAPSEMSKRGMPVWPPMLRRDVSSVYPESEIGTVKSRKTVNSDWEDEPLPSLAGDESLNSRPDMYRAFSFNPGSEATFNNGGRAPSVPMAGIDSSLSAQQEDKTNALAQEYISGLPTSPFVESPPHTSPALPSTEISPRIGKTTSPQNMDKIASAPSTPVRTRDMPSSPVSSGSVRHYEDKGNSTRSFIDETLDSSPTIDRSNSPASFFSVPEPEEEGEAPFKSAVEIQPFRSRSRSPKKLTIKSTIPEETTPREGVRGPKSDSGYSSNTSLGPVLPPLEKRNTVQDEVNNIESDRRRGLRFPFQKTQKSGKPILIKPTPSTKLPSPKSARIESASALTSTTSFLPTEGSTQYSAMSLPASPVKPKDKRKRLTKLRRKSTVEVAGELVVQRLASVECFNIPPVSVSSKSNLAQRSHAIPELERTYRTAHHTAKSTNASVLSLATAPRELRFPSPAPEEEEREGRSESKTRSRSRGRSFSRPRSWLGWPKRDKSSSRANSKDRENLRTELNDFGSVSYLLSDDPYDIATKPRPAMPPSAWNNRPDFLRRRTSPSTLSNNAPLPKPTMDDKTASKVSKLRRRSMTERDNREENRRSMDERGGIPWTSPHKAPLSTDVPPLPPMPSPQEINNRLSYKQNQPTRSRPSSDAENRTRPGSNQLPEHLSIDEPREAPPPPPHSPMPTYLEDENPEHYVTEPEQVYDEQNLSNLQSYLDDESGFENAIDDNAPPPPSHSPRPMDITHAQRSRDASWSSQANAWKARRLSAGEALRRSWGKVEQFYRAPQPSDDNPTRHPSVPRRKPVPNRWSMYESVQQPSYQQWRSGDYQQDDNESHHQPRQQPMYAQNQFWDPPEQDWIDQRQSYDQYDTSRQHEYLDQHFPSDSPQGYDDYSCYQQQHRNNSEWTSPSQQYNFYHEYNNQNGHQNQPYQAYHPDREYNQQRSVSRHSQVSRKSIGDELHLDPLPSRSTLMNNVDPYQRSSSRYSVGPELEYEAFSHGSNGSRSASRSRGNNIWNDGKKRSSWLDMDAYGMDYTNIPVLGAPVGPIGDRMMYR